MLKPIFALSAALILFGCSSGSSRVVGTWKGKLEAPEHPQNLADAATGFVAALVGDMTLEFNADGKYKMSISLASKTGTYSVSGNEVRLTPEDGKDKPQIFILDGDELRAKKDFASDPDLVLKRQAPEK